MVARSKMQKAYYKSLVMTNTAMDQKSSPQPKQSDKGIVLCMFSRVQQNIKRGY